MKSKQEILNNYYSQGLDGRPEITADDLLKAMDEYACQIFDAARLIKDNSNYYLTFKDLISDLERPKQPENKLNENLQLIADSILPQFIPADGYAREVTFDIKTNGKIYTVHYFKNSAGYWEFQNYTG